MINNTCGNTGLGSMQKWHIGNDVREILMSDATLSGLVGTNVFPIIAPEKTEGEFIVYRRDKYSKEWTKLGVVSDECVLVISAVAGDYDTAVNMAELIDNALTGTHTNQFNERFQMRLLDASEDYQDGKFIEVLLFNVK